MTVVDLEALPFVAVKVTVPERWLVNTPFELIVPIPESDTLHVAEVSVNLLPKASNAFIVKTTLSP